MSYASIAKYTTELLVVNEFQNQTFTCEPKPREVPCRYPTGDFYISQMYPDAEDRFVFNWVMSCVWVLIMFIAAVSVLHWNRKQLR